jgi:hypothetical protein
MAYGMAFKGVYRYASAAEVDAAFAELAELLRGADADFRVAHDAAVFAREGLAVRIDVEMSAPPSFYMAFETIVERFAEHAIEGNVDARFEGTLESFPAGASA